MDQVVANELPNTQMEACGVGHIPLPPRSPPPRTEIHTYTFMSLIQRHKSCLGTFSLNTGIVTHVVKMHNQPFLDKQ